MPLIWRKDQALNELVEKKRTPPEMFDDLHKNFENALNQLKADAQTTLENLDKEVVRCGLHVTELRLALLHLEIEHEIGEIDEKSYQTAIEMHAWEIMPSDLLLKIDQDPPREWLESRVLARLETI